MTFTEALSAAFNDDDRITRSSWIKSGVYVAVEDGKLQIWNGVIDDDMWHPWTISDADYFATDWEVVADV
jgi:hypothetical protein